MANADGVLLDIPFPLPALGVKAPAAEKGRVFLPDPDSCCYKSWLVAFSLCKTLEMTSFSLIEFLASLSY